MLKDNENVELPDWATDDPVDISPSPFAHNQMVRCEECLRANPPTRLNCLYCAAALPLSDATVTMQKPALRPLEKWERGYNNILLPPAANLDDAGLAEVADLLRLSSEDLNRILTAGIPLPLARAATLEEAQLVERRLKQLGISSLIVRDDETGLDEIVKVRSLEADEEGIYAYQTPEASAIHVPWTDLVLLVVGRLVSKRVELKEQKAGRAENRILSDSEFTTDELVVDLYSRKQSAPYRIAANSFDFSCLGQEKGWLAAENLARLMKSFRERAPHVEYDETFAVARKALEAVWPSEQQNASSGWRRERPGKYSVGSIMERSNEAQFLRYSQLRRYLTSDVLTRTEQDA